MDKVSIRLEITCSQLVKAYCGKHSALTKCNFLLPSSAEQPSDPFPSIGRAINRICSWTYANAVSTLPKEERVPGRGGKGRDGTEGQPVLSRLESPPALAGTASPAQPGGRAADGVGKQSPSSSESSSCSQHGKSRAAWAGVLPPHGQGARRGEALSSHTRPGDTLDCQSGVCLVQLRCTLSGEVTTKKMAGPSAPP